MQPLSYVICRIFDIVHSMAVVHGGRCPNVLYCLQSTVAMVFEGWQGGVERELITICS